MPWKEEPSQSKKEQKNSDKWLKSTCKKKPKFFCDEDLPANTSLRLRNSGYNAISVYENHLQGKLDPVIYTEAFKKKRIFLTRDADFWNDCEFKLKYATPTIILSSLNFEAALLSSLHYITPYHEVFKQTKIKVSQQECMPILTIKYYSLSGTIEKNKYRFRGNCFEKFHEK